MLRKVVIFVVVFVIAFVALKAIGIGEPTAPVCHPKGCEYLDNGVLDDNSDNG